MSKNTGAGAVLIGALAVIFAVFALHLGGALPAPSQAVAVAEMADVFVPAG